MQVNVWYRPKNHRRLIQKPEDWLRNNFSISVRYNLITQKYSPYSTDNRLLVARTLGILLQSRSAFYITFAS